MAYDNKTKDWQLFEAGKKYNNSLKPNYYDTVDTNLAFFNGDQWRNLEDSSMPKPVFNLIKRVVTFLVASLTSANAKINIEPLLYAEDSPNEQMQQEQHASDIANAQIDNLLEKFKMPNRIREALFDGANTGDFCAHFFFDMSQQPYGGAYSDIKGEIQMELVDGVNVYFGNANNPRTDVQPYIIIEGRDMVENLKEEAKRYRAKQEDINLIESDSNYDTQAGDNGKLEVEADEYGKAQFIIVYRKDKKTGTIKASKCVESAYIYKGIDTGLNHYPVAWGNWERVKNSYHGRALCTGMLPNQIFINRMFAMVMYHLMMTAFPKGVYNAEVISGWSNEIGTAIPIRGLGPDFNVKNVAGYLEPGNMSAQIVQVIDLAMQYTKETLGVSDAALGNIDPKNTSATIAVQKSSAIPLENPKANLYEWIEDIGKILFDMMGTYYGVRPIVVSKEVVSPEGKKVTQKVVEQFDFSILKNMWLKVKADVGEASYWSEIASVQTLDNLLKEGYIEITDYLERLPDEYVPKRQELIADLKARMEAQVEQNAQFEQMAQWLESQPPEVQQQIMSLPAGQKEQVIMQMMQGGMNNGQAIA